MADPARLPVIAVTGPQKGSAVPRLCIALGIRMAGGEALQLRPRDRSSARPFQGVVISGGHDIDPVLYAQESSVHPSYDQDVEPSHRAPAQDAPRVPGQCPGGDHRHG